MVSPDQYELSKVSARQRLTPLDMNMPRLYGMRWILCFPLSPNADKLKMYKVQNQTLLIKFDNCNTDTMTSKLD